MYRPYNLSYSRRRKRRRAVSRPRYVRGRGSYVGQIAREGLKVGGGFLGGLGGAMVPLPGSTWLGGELGSAAGSKIADVLGIGGYNVKVNSLTLDEGAQIPAFGDLGQAVIIKHREYITDISVPTPAGTFTNDTFIINPGDPKTFPWLSHLARSFDQYMILGLIFEFRSTSTDYNAAANLGQGTIIMATDYDATDAPYADKLAMENSQYCTTTKPSESMMHIIECDPSVTAQPHLFVRHTGVPLSGDLRFYDHGKFQIATQGLPAGATGTIGELHCTYQVAFFKPQLHNEDSLVDTWLKIGAGPTNTMLTGIPSGDPNPPQAGSTLGGLLDGNTYYFPGNTKVGDKFLLKYLSGGVSTLLVNTWTATTLNVTVTMETKTPAGSTADHTFIWVYVTITSVGFPPSVQFSGATMPASISRSMLNVVKLEKDNVYWT